VPGVDKARVSASDELASVVAGCPR
jgi:hypothetical protein